jgi:hypothetical protein
MLPHEQVLAVEQYVSDELRSAEQYDNRQPLDESGVWSLHALAAAIYAAGWAAGELAEAERQRYKAQREREAQRTADAAS